MSKEPQHFEPVVHAALAFSQSLRDNPPPVGKPVLGPAPVKEAARSLMAAAADWHRGWESERKASGRGFRMPDRPMPQPRTPFGRLVRAAKAFGYAQRPEAAEKEYSDSLLELLNAAQALPRQGSRKAAERKPQPQGWR